MPVNPPPKGSAVDVAVIGGGIAGLIAANRAAELGLAVAVLEKGSDERYLCNSRFTGGVFHVAFHNPMRPPAELRSIILGATGPEASPAMVDAVADNIGRVVRWLQGEGIRFVKAGRAEWQDWILSPPQYPRAGLHWPGRGGDVLLRTLGQNLLRRGGSIQRGTRVTGLEPVAGAGFRVAHGQDRDLLARSVVVADGGFQGNPELLRSYVTGRPEGLRQRGAGTGCGDGLSLVEAIGGGIVRSAEFYGHVLSQDSLRNDALWPYPWIDDLAGAGIAVDGTATRFVDEGRGGVVLANAIARLQNPLSAVAIFDDAIWETVGRDMLIPANPLLEIHGCTIQVAQSLAQLAESVQLPPAALERTVAAYNAALARNDQTTLDPPRGEERFRSCPIVKPPFRAIRICPGITYTMGGIAIDGESRVLTPNGTPIHGLYAAGATTGGLEGGSRVGYVGGLVKSSVTGLLAAESIARIGERVHA